MHIGPTDLWTTGMQKLTEYSDRAILWRWYTLLAAITCGDTVNIVCVTFQQHLQGPTALNGVKQCMQYYIAIREHIQNLLIQGDTRVMA